MEGRVGKGRWRVGGADLPQLISQLTPDLPHPTLTSQQAADHPNLPRAADLFDELVGIGDHIRVECLYLRLDARGGESLGHVLYELRVVLVHDWPQVDRAWSGLGLELGSGVGL